MQPGSWVCSERPALKQNTLIIIIIIIIINIIIIIIIVVIIIIIINNIQLDPPTTSRLAKGKQPIWVVNDTKPLGNDKVLQARLKHY